MLERKIRQDEAEIKSISRAVRGIDDPVKKTEAKNLIGELEAKIAATKELVPADWKQVNKDFMQITKQLNRARMQFRRQSDNAYSNLNDLRLTIESAEDLAALKTKLQGVRDNASNIGQDQTLAEIKTIYSALNRVPDMGEAAKLLSIARKAIDNKSSDINKAMDAVDKAILSIKSELGWRVAAKNGVLEKLSSLEAYTKNNLGLREQNRLTAEQVEFVTPCLASHRDLSLQF